MPETPQTFTASSETLPQQDAVEMGPAVCTEFTDMIQQCHPIDHPAYEQNG